MIGKMVLPLLGGTPAVWNTCMVFFQATLLAGYLYVHALTTWLRPTRQALLHVALLTCSMLALPIVLVTAGDPPVEMPVWWLLRTLVVSVGIPFFMVSTSSPLLSYSLNVFGDRYLASDGSVREADVNAFYNVQFKDLLSLQGFFGPSELQTSPGVIQWFNRRQIQLGYRQGTPEPLTVAYTWGPFAGGYVQQTQFIDQRVFGPYALSFEYDGNIERARAGGPIQNSQWLRRFTFLRSIGSYASFGVQLRGINGTGGFAEPGTNLSLLYQQRFVNEDYLYLEYGTPAAAQTLHRFIIKYVFHAGGQTGT